MLARILLLAGLVSAGLLLILVTTTTPSSAGALGILAVFLLTYIVVLVSFTFTIWALAKFVNKIGLEAHLFRKRYDFTLKRSYYYSSVLALGPVIVVSLQSVGSVGVYEMGLVALFIFLGCLYVSRRLT